MSRLRQFKSVLLALLAAALYGASLPLSKQLLSAVPPLMLAALLYLGAGVGMLMLTAAKKALCRAQNEAGLDKGDVPTLLLMVGLDIAAPILLMLGLTHTSAANASLLSNFEIVATTIVARLLFGEAIGKRHTAAVVLITLSSILLTVEDVSALHFSGGSLLVLLACACWGLENNCTRKLSLKNPAHIVVVKGLGSGAGALLVALVCGEAFPAAGYALLCVALGFASYGLGIQCYIAAQRELGASRTSALYAVSPFIGAAIAIAAFGESVSVAFLVAAAVMTAGIWLSVGERHAHAHVHPQTEHTHSHTHDDGHHTHTHGENSEGAHSHPHVHEPFEHTHRHWPDMHHTHPHL